MSKLDEHKRAVVDVVEKCCEADKKRLRDEIAKLKAKNERLVRDGDLLRGWLIFAKGHIPGSTRKGIIDSIDQALQGDTDNG